MNVIGFAENSAQLITITKVAPGVDIGLWMIDVEHCVLNV
jgi:hypothetical protein